MAGTRGPTTRSGAPPVPTVVRSGVAESGATVTGDSLAVLESVLQCQQAVREQLEAARAERFHAGEDPFTVGLEAVPAPAAGELPAVAREWLRGVSDDRWHEVHRSMLLAGYPPGQDGGRCDRDTATRAIAPCESAGVHTLRCRVDRVTPLPDAPDGCLRIDLDGGRSIAVTLDAPRDIEGLLDGADHVSLTKHSPAALATARSLGGALADTPPISISFEQAHARREYGTLDQGVGSRVDTALVEALEAAPSFPAAPTPQVLAEALEQGPFTTDERIAVTRLAAGHVDRIRLRYGESVPRLVAAIADVLDSSLAAVPQAGDVVVCAGDVPASLAELAAGFPDDQHLTTADRATLADALETPPEAVSDPTNRDRYRATATAAELALAGDVSVADAFFLQVYPWIPAATEDAVHRAAGRGRDLVAELTEWADSVEPSLVRPPLQTCWELAAGADAGPIPGVG